MEHMLLKEHFLEMDILPRSRQDCLSIMASKSAHQVQKTEITLILN